MNEIELPLHLELSSIVLIHVKSMINSNNMHVKLEFFFGTMIIKYD